MPEWISHLDTIWSHIALFENALSVISFKLEYSKLYHIQQKLNYWDKLLPGVFRKARNILQDAIILGEGEGGVGTVDLKQIRAETWWKIQHVRNVCGTHDFMWCGINQNDWASVDGLCILSKTMVPHGCMWNSPTQSHLQKSCAYKHKKSLKMLMICELLEIWQ